MRKLSLYIHIPFCVKKCNYCDFLSKPYTEEERQKYIQSLCKEIRDKGILFNTRKIDTIYFGGGTPSLLSVEQVSEIMNVVRKKFEVLPEAEISMEVNPGTVTRDKLEGYKKLGINRLSIGLQSADNAELEMLGRIHTWEDFRETWNMVRETGFDNVNIDLMSALPNQTVESYESTLKKVLALKPEHISAYSLIVEEGTPFYDRFGPNGKEMLSLPTEENDRAMYEMTEKILAEQGFQRYEISNYALPGHECRHNICYWKRGEYLGVGLGAASMFYLDLQDFENDHYWQEKNIRSRNLSQMEKYFNERYSYEEETDVLTEEEQMEEFMFLGLRMMEGISEEEFWEFFGVNVEEVYGEQIQKLMEQGLLVHDKEAGRYALSNRGIDVSNQVFVEFIH